MKINDWTAFGPSFIIILSLVNKESKMLTSFWVGK